MDVEAGSGGGCIQTVGHGGGGLAAEFFFSPTISGKSLMWQHYTGLTRAGEGR